MRLNFVSTTRSDFSILLPLITVIDYSGYSYRLLVFGEKHLTMVQKEVEKYNLNAEVCKFEFNEKPQSLEGRISGGFFVASPKLFDYLHNSEDLVFEQEPIRKLVSDNQVMMYKHDGFWQPMDTSREYQLLNSLYNKGEAPWTK